MLSSDPLVSYDTDYEPEPVPGTPFVEIDGSSQEAALYTFAQHTLYHGSRGPGKTDTQLFRFFRRVGKGYGPFWRGVIFDREYKNLDDLVAKSKRWFRLYDNPSGRWLASAKDYKWVWETGEELLFRVAKKPDDYWDYHGQEFPFIGWNELTKYPTSELYDMLMSCNRSSWTQEKNGEPDDDGELPKPIPLEVFSTANPYGAGHAWVKRRFIDVAKPGEVFERVINVFNPQTQKREDITFTQVAIFGTYRENKYLDPLYVASLESERDPNRKKAWLSGSWDIVAGGAFDDLWSPPVHILPRFKVPPTWRLDRALDWGSSHPYYCGWFAEANGEEAQLENGMTFCPPVGSLVLCHEVYGTHEIGTNSGLRHSAKTVAEKIRDAEIELLEAGWIINQPWPGPADNQIRDVRESDVDTIEKKMSDEGIRWTSSDKSPGSRRNGLQLMRDRLESAITGEGPALYFMDHCRAALATVPVLPRDPDNMDDVDTTAEDHPYDAIRYRVLAGANRLATVIKTTFAR